MAHPDRFGCSNLHVIARAPPCTAFETANLAKASTLNTKSHVLGRGDAEQALVQVCPRGVAICARIQDVARAHQHPRPTLLTDRDPDGDVVPRRHVVLQTGP